MTTYYSKSHECINVTDNVATLNISDFAIEELGDIVYVELPEEDSEVSKGDSFIVIESVKAASDIYAPISGTVIEINEEVSDNPSVINDKDQATGWLIKIAMSNPEELNDLMDQESYLKTIA